MSIYGGATRLTGRSKRRTLSLRKLEHALHVESQEHIERGARDGMSFGARQYRAQAPQVAHKHPLELLLVSVADLLMQRHVSGFSSFF